MVVKHTIHPLKYKISINYMCILFSLMSFQGASFRNKGQILALAGCDKLTISPTLLAELGQSNGAVERALSSEDAHKNVEKLEFDEKSFRWALNGRFWGVFLMFLIDL